VTSDYQPPLTAMSHALAASGLAEILQLETFADLSERDVADVLEGFGRFAAEVLAPTDRIGDLHGVHHDPATGSVTTPEPIRKAFHNWVADGWSGLTMPTSLGGGGLPVLVGLAVEEMFASANMALSLQPMLSQGAMHLLGRWGSDDQQDRFLRPLVRGQWSGTMNLTEPDAGSDLGAIRTNATLREDGYWEVTGTKIFITWGEHDLCENIVHLVLARTPDAPPGTKGISLFAVPHRHVGPDGTLGERNAVRCVGIEHKLGIHASPTCILQFDRAIGELVGPLHGGMPAMFTMMNAARLSVGLEGLAVSERAHQQALDYARTRTQGRSGPSRDPDPIVEHPDVRRMLLSTASSIDAMRALLYATAAAGDLSRNHPDPDVRATMAARADLLTPIAKAWCTDEGVRNSSLALQVHGGAGYIEETGIAQRLRDSRIAPIYEGTNGIQAIDLAGRKVRRDHGLAMLALCDDLNGFIDDVADMEGMTDTAAVLGQAVRVLRDMTRWILQCDRDEQWLAAAYPYSEVAALATTGGLLARQLRSIDQTSAEDLEPYAGRLRFFALERVAHAPAYQAVITAGDNNSQISHLG
jgi:3-(methylthio)propanoyl-CoA dehydrogenase